jgi:hypothetical protein
MSATSMRLINKLQNYDDPNSLASRMRRRRARHVTRLIGEIHARTGACRIVDLGGRPAYWDMFDRAFLDQHGVHVTLVNLNEPAPTDDPLFTSIAGDACSLPQFADGAFDLVHSNSTVEHVGDWDKVERFAAEVRRLAPRYYVQTPYAFFPVEPHFSAICFHWLPEPVRASILMKRRMGFMADRAADIGEAMRAVQDARLLSKRMFRFLFQDAQYPDERFAGLTKSLIAIRA